jgi:hypothetical protein
MKREMDDFAIDQPIMDFFYHAVVDGLSVVEKPLLQQGNRAGVINL